MVIECENSTDIEIIIGTYEEFVLGYKAMKTEDGVSLSQSFANHSHRASVRCVAGGGRFMASGGADDMIQLYDMKLRKEMGVLMHHDRTVTCLVFIGQSHLASGSDDGELALWRTGSWQCEKTFKAHPDSGICAIAVHPSGKLCLTAGKDQKLRTWSLVKGRAAYTTNIHAVVEDLTWSVTGDYYAVLKVIKGGAQFSVDIYETASAAVIYAIVPEHRPSCMCFMQDHVVAVGTVSGTIELHSVNDKAMLCSWQAHDGRIRCLKGVKFTTGGMWLVSAANNGDIAVWKYQEQNDVSKKSTKTPKCLGRTSAGCRVTSMTLITVPPGAVPCKSEVTDLITEDLKVETVVARAARQKVIIELENSSEEEQDDSPATQSKQIVGTAKNSHKKKSKEKLGKKNKIKRGLITKRKTKKVKK